MPAFIRTGILAVVGILIGLYIYLFEIKQKGREALQEEALRRIFPVSQHEVEKLQLTYKSSQYLCLRDSAEQWLISEPLQYPADQEEVGLIIREMSLLEKTETLGKVTKGVKEFGLDPPAVKLQLWKRGSSESSLFLFGNLNPSRENVYIMDGKDSTVSLSASHILSKVKKTLFDIRDKDVVSFDRDNIVSIKAQSAEQGSWKITKKDKGEWDLIEPVIARAQKNKITTMLDNLVFTKAKEFIDIFTTDNRYGLQPPLTTITVWSSAHHQVTIQVGTQKRDERQTIVKRNDRNALFVVNDKFISTFYMSYHELRDSVLIAFNPSELDSLSLIDAKDNYRFTRDANKMWMYKHGQAIGKNDVDTKVSELITALNGLTFKKIVADHPSSYKKYGLVSPLLTVVLYRDEKPIAEMQYGAYKGKTDAFYFKHVQSTAVYLISAESFNKASHLLSSP